MSITNIKCKYESSVIAAAGILLFSLCARDYNPFTDRTLAKTVIFNTSTISKGDTVEIFHSETLDVGIAVVDLVDSVVIHIESDRYSNGNQVLYGGTTATPPVQGRFIISLCDTGTQKIDILTHLAGGGTHNDGFEVYCTSPLDQDTVFGSYDDPVQLFTPPVFDKDVLYHWDFGIGNTFESASNSPLVAVPNAGQNNTGYLWVSDPENSHNSTKTDFRFIFIDTTGPGIECINSGFEGSDTIATGASSFFLQVKITDRGGPVDSVTINNGSFDLVDGSVHVKIVNDINQSSNACIPFEIHAWDRHLIPNESIKTIYICHNPDLPDAGQGVRIIVKIPSNDTIVCGTEHQYVLGNIENYSNATVLINVLVNGTAGAYSDTLGPGESGSSWAREITLAPGSNTVQIEARNTAGVLLDKKLIVMDFQTLLNDTFGPEVLSLTVNGADADGLTVPDDSIILKVLCFDLGSGISSVTVNEAAMVQTGIAATWEKTIRLSHGSKGNNLVVKAIDTQGNATETDVDIFQNRVPVILDWLSPATWPIIAGSTFLDTIIVRDDDGDQITFDTVKVPVGLSLSQDGTILWNTSINDTGKNELALWIKDGMSQTPYACTLDVVDSIGFAECVVFKIDELDFPSSAEAGDTVSVALLRQDSTGTAPYTYSIKRRVGAMYEDIAVTLEKFVWVPSEQDTGFQHFIIRITDAKQCTDVLYPMILVVPQNRDFSISKQFPGDTLSDGTIDLRNTAEPKTLVIHINDPDTSLIESYTVKISINGIQNLRTISGTDSFEIVLDPLGAPAGVNKIIIDIEDMGGHSHADTLRVLYRAISAVINTSALGANITETQYNFPLLVRLNSVVFPYFEDAGDSGSGIWFIKPDGTVLAHEIERWDAQSSTAEIWVLMDTVLAANSTQYIEMYWDSDVSGNNSGAGTVFDTLRGFEAVWHLGENLLDATPHSYDGTDHGTTMTEGVTGYCRSFDGTNDYVSAARSEPVLKSAAAATLECWAYTSGTNQMAVISIATWNNGNPTSYSRASIVINETNSGRIILLGRSNDNQTDGEFLTNDLGSGILNGWHHFTGIFNIEKDSILLFVDGVLSKSQLVTFSSSTTPATNSELTVLGSQDDYSKQFFKGMLDEARISRIKRSDSWIKLSYENQKPGSTVVTIE